MTILVLPATEKKILNAVTVNPGEESSWVDMVFGTPVTYSTIWLNCPAEKGTLLTELSLDGSSWLSLSDPLTSPNFLDFGYSPLPFGSEWNWPNGVVMVLSGVPHKRLRFKIAIDAIDSAPRTADLWILGM